MVCWATQDFQLWPALPRHYLNPLWFSINRPLWHLPQMYLKVHMKLDPQLLLAKGITINILKTRGSLYWNRLALTHWGWVTYICNGNLTIIVSDNGLLPGRHQAIIWTSAGILLIGPLGTKFNEILIVIHIFLFKKMHLKGSSENGGHFASASMC